MIQTFFFFFFKPVGFTGARNAGSTKRTYRTAADILFISELMHFHIKMCLMWYSLSVSFQTKHPIIVAFKIQIQSLHSPSRALN